MANLAREAGVSRATAYRASHIAREFQTLTARRTPSLEREPASRAKQRQEREELQTLRVQASVLAQQIQALTLLTLEQDRQLAALYAERSQSGGRVAVASDRSCPRLKRLRIL